MRKGDFESSDEFNIFIAFHDYRQSINWNQNKHIFHPFFNDIKWEWSEFLVWRYDVYHTYSKYWMGCQHKYVMITRSYLLICQLSLSRSLCRSLPFLLNARQYCILLQGYNDRCEPCYFHTQIFCFARIKITTQNRFHPSNELRYVSMTVTWRSFSAWECLFAILHSLTQHTHTTHLLWLWLNIYVILLEFSRIYECVYVFKFDWKLELRFQLLRRVVAQLLRTWMKWSKRRD